MHMLAIRAPEYFPRMTYIALIMASETFVLADTFQYSRQSFQNRTPIRTPDDWQWLSTPLTGKKSTTPIYQVLLDTKTDWKGKQKRTLKTYYQSSPFYAYYEPLLEDVIEKPFNTLGELATASILFLHEYLGLTTTLVRASELPHAPQTLAEIIAHEKAHSLLALPDTAPHSEGAGYDVTTFFPKEVVYRQNFEGFVPNLSALDLLFNYGPEAISMLKAMLQR